MNRSALALLLVLAFAGGLASPASACSSNPSPVGYTPEDTVGLMSQEVAMVHLQKQGYTNIQGLVLVGDLWTATATRAGQTYVVTINGKSGERKESPAPATPAK